MTLRRTLPLLIAAMLALAGCSTGSADSDSADTGTEAGSSDAFPVTIEHAFGATTIESPPERVATISWVNADVVLALGVVPVAIPLDEYGGNENGSTPWKDEALEDLDAAIGTENAPEQFSEADGINFNAIAQAEPDVIIGAYSGLTEEEYDKLSEIAPVIAYPEIAYGTSWQDSTTMTGKALGKQDEAADVIAEVEESVADEAATYPDIAGKTFIFGTIEAGAPDGLSVYQSIDNRPRFMEMIGMVLAPVVVEAEKTAEPGFHIPWSPEKASELESDVFLSWVDSEDSLTEIENDPLLSQIPAVKNDSLVLFTDDTMTLSTSAASPLSLPWAVTQYLPLIDQAVQNSTG